MNEQEFRQKDETKKPDIYVAIPTASEWTREFGSSMIALAGHFSRMSREGKIKGYRVDSLQTSNLSKLRQTLLDRALASPCTHILWIDDDTQFPPEAVETMLSRNKPWLASNVCKKNGDGWIARYEGGAVVNSTGKTGCEKIGSMGLGMVLIELDAIRHVPVPHFEVRWMDEQRGYLGEDLYFLLKCKEAGVEIWVDHDVSNSVRHIGNYGYGAQDIPAEKMEAAA